MKKLKESDLENVKDALINASLSLFNFGESDNVEVAFNMTTKEVVLSNGEKILFTLWLIPDHRLFNKKGEHIWYFEISPKVEKIDNLPLTGPRLDIDALLEESIHSILKAGSIEKCEDLVALANFYCYMEGLANQLINTYDIYYRLTRNIKKK